MEDDTMKSKFGKIVYAIFIITLVIAFACSVAPIAKYAYNRMKENRILKEIEQQKQESEVIVTEEPSLRSLAARECGITR